MGKHHHLQPVVRHVLREIRAKGIRTPVAHVMSPLTGLAGRLPGAQRGAQRVAAFLGSRVGEAPSQATVERATTSTVAEVRDSAGGLLSRVELRGPEAYGLTAALLAWGATRAAREGVRGTGALGPVQAFGLAELTGGAAAAGLVRT